MLVGACESVFTRTLDTGDTPRTLLATLHLQCEPGTHGFPELLCPFYGAGVFAHGGAGGELSPCSQPSWKDMGERVDRHKTAKHSGKQSSRLKGLCTHDFVFLRKTNIVRV